ncbi:MAG: AAA family ATPase [Desulfuromonadales bacterium]
MKLNKLIIKAYGHFSNRELDFSSPLPGLHIIHGPNEAGKSTALRALKGLFFGIPERTADNFMHSYDQLLVGGCLEAEDGGQLTLYRRKKRVGDLLSANMEQLDPALLARFLQGIEPALFDSLYGIDQETLVSGGRDILEQKGDVGQALFAAGAGLSSLHGIIAELEREYADIFKPSGSKPELNRAIREYNECLKASRALSLSTNEWEQCRKAYETTIEDLKTTEQQLIERNSELARLKRISKALPKLAVRNELIGRLAEREQASRLPEDFPEQLHAILLKREAVAQKLNEAESRRTKLDGDRLGLNVSREILDQEETIDSLHQRLGVERQARKDRPALYEKMIRARTEAESLLRRVAPDCDLAAADTLKGVLGKRQSITRLGNRFEALEQSLTHAGDQFRNAGLSLSKAEQRLNGLAAVGDLLPLSSALTLATKAGDPDSTIRTLRHDCLTTRTTVEAIIAGLGLWQGTPEELSSLQLPSNETVMHFLDALLENGRTLKECRVKLKELQDEHDQVQCDIKAMELIGSVLTHEELMAARDGREQRWRLVKRAWLDGEDVSYEAGLLGDEASLPEAYEQSVHGSDDVSDRLRSEAERVHAYAGHRALREKLALQMSRWRDAERVLLAEYSAIEVSWNELWQSCGISPGTPKEMRDWLNRCHNVRRTTEELLAKEAQVVPSCEQRDALVKLLNHELEALGRGRRFSGDELTPVLEYATRIYDELNGISSEQAKLRDEICRLITDRRTAEEAVIASQAALDGWRLLWQEALQGLGLSEGSTPAEAMEALENLRTCLEQRDMSGGYQLRIDEIDRHAREFGNDVAALVKEAAPALDGIPPEQAVVKLQSMLTEARKAMSVLEKIQEDILLADDDIRMAALELTSIDEALEVLKSRTGCETDEKLVEMETLFKEFLKYREELEQVTRGLTELSEGIPLETIAQQASGVDPNELPARMDALDRSIQDDIAPRIKSLSEKKGAGRILLEQMDGSGKAAEMLEKAESALARVRRLAGRYVRLKVAGQILKREIELYRCEHQDPVLKIASRYFAELTFGAYAGLKTDLDDDGQPVLAGITTDARSRTVDQMSSGTRDQLYLSLRLATLEWRLEKHQPMPFIADDLLVNFDDTRSEATLRALSELGTKNQVILFTHHRQIVTIAESLGQKERIFIHELGG